MTLTRMLGFAVLVLIAGCGGGSNAPMPGELKLAAAAYGAAEGAGTVTVTVTRTGGSDGAATVSYATANGTATAGSDYTAATGTLNWADGDAAAKTFTITLADDDDVEADETVAVTLSNATGASLGTPASATVTITNDDEVAVSMTGVAATGAPIVGATITVVDAAGATASATTGNDGTYAVDIGGMAPPLLVRVELGGGAALYSVSNVDEPTVVNVHPLTDLVVRAWYDAQGTTVADAFDDPAANPPPAPAQVAFIVDVVERVIRLWLDSAGIDADAFDLIATPFDADGSGFDGILDDTTIDPDTGAMEIDDGTTTQVVTVTTGASLSFASTTTGAGGTSSSVVTTTVPASAGASAALNGIKQTLEDVASLVHTAGDGLTADDFLPFIATEALDEGRDREVMAAVFASELRGLTIDAMELGTLYAVGDGEVEADLLIRMSLGELSGKEQLRMRFLLEDEVWKLGGDGRGVRADANMERRVDMGQNGGGNEIYYAVNVHIDAPVDTVDSITIDGGDVFDGDEVPPSGQISVDEFDDVVVQMETFFLNTGALAGPVPAGTEFTITVNYIGGGSETFTAVTGGTTDEAVLITAPTAHTLATANLGGELPVTWTLPKSFSIDEIVLGGIAFTQPQGSGGFACQAEPELDPTPTSTSGTLALPTMCNAEAVVEVNINLQFRGVNGERIQVIYFMGSE